MRKFRLVTGVFYQGDIEKIELPKMIFKDSGGQHRLIDEKSTICVHFYGRPNVSRDIATAVNEGLKECKIEFFENSQTYRIASVWVFENAKIKAVDFGVAMFEGDEDRLIQCEIGYDKLVIDNTQIR